MTTEQYNTSLPSMRKAWKVEFNQFLIEYYKPSIINAENVFKAVGKADSFIKKHTSLDTKLLLIKDIEVIKQLRTSMLSHQSFAMGPTISANDYKVIVLDRYIDFLQKKIKSTSVSGSRSLSPKDDSIQNATEGYIEEIKYFRSKRNRAIRDQCAVRDHYTCQVCGFNFEKVYGERGKGFIEIHHKKPLASYDGEHEVLLEDLIGLCSNCHSMIHNGKELLNIDNLKELLEKCKVK